MCGGSSIVRGGLSIVPRGLNNCSRGPANCLWESFLVRREFFKSLKFLANVSSIPRKIYDSSEPPEHICWTFGASNTNVGLCHFFDIRILCESFTFPWNTHLNNSTVPAQEQNLWRWCWWSRWPMWSVGLSGLPPHAPSSSTAWR